MPWSDPHAEMFFPSRVSFRPTVILWSRPRLFGSQERRYLADFTVTATVGNPKGDEVPWLEEPWRLHPEASKDHSHRVDGSEVGG